MTWLYVLLAGIAFLYLSIGLAIAVARARDHAMPVGLFIFTVILWPSLWSG